MFEQADDDLINVPYREAILGETLLFLVQTTRPDIAFAMRASQFVENPCKAHWNALKRIIKYLKGIMDYGLLYEAGNN